MSPFDCFDFSRLGVSWVKELKNLLTDSELLTMSSLTDSGLMTSMLTFLSDSGWLLSSTSTLPDFLSLTTLQSSLPVAPKSLMAGLNLWHPLSFHLSLNLQAMMSTNHSSLAESVFRWMSLLSRILSDLQLLFAWMMMSLLPLDLLKL